MASAIDESTELVKECWPEFEHGPSDKQEVDERCAKPVDPSQLIGSFHSSVSHDESKITKLKDIEQTAVCHKLTTPSLEKLPTSASDKKFRMTLNPDHVSNKLCRADLMDKLRQASGKNSSIRGYSDEAGPEVLNLIAVGLRTALEEFNRIRMAKKLNEPQLQQFYLHFSELVEGYRSFNKINKVEYVYVLHDGQYDARIRLQHIRSLISILSIRGWKSEKQFPKVNNVVSALRAEPLTNKRVRELFETYIDFWFEQFDHSLCLDKIYKQFPPNYLSGQGIFADHIPSIRIHALNLILALGVMSDALWVAQDSLSEAEVSEVRLFLGDYCRSAFDFMDYSWSASIEPKAKVYWFERLKICLRANDFSLISLVFSQLDQLGGACLKLEEYFHELTRFGDFLLSAFGDPDTSFPDFYNTVCIARMLNQSFHKGTLEHSYSALFTPELQRYIKAQEEATDEERAQGTDEHSSIKFQHLKAVVEGVNIFKEAVIKIIDTVSKFETEFMERAEADRVLQLESQQILEKGQDELPQWMKKDKAKARANPPKKQSKHKKGCKKKANAKRPMVTKEEKNDSMDGLSLAATETTPRVEDIVDQLGSQVRETYKTSLKDLKEYISDRRNPPTNKLKAHLYVIDCCLCHSFDLIKAIVRCKKKYLSSVWQTSLELQQINSIKQKRQERQQQQQQLVSLQEEFEEMVKDANASLVELLQSDTKRLEGDFQIAIELTLESLQHRESKLSALLTYQTKEQKVSIAKTDEVRQRIQESYWSVTVKLPETKSAASTARFCPPIRERVHRGEGDAYSRRFQENFLVGADNSANIERALEKAKRLPPRQVPQATLGDFFQTHSQRQHKPKPKPQSKKELLSAQPLEKAQYVKVEVLDLVFQWREITEKLKGFSFKLKDRRAQEN
ncbi:hypothetical protein D5018_18900 [Parashewanella curva]|uniref:Uncharacterized protein n=1 Tax=Parashewanella curva TaxID=2338552 RepID=A0A3L8PRU6_9GAMM|nr:hypothetical protein [Parashewanella curva]RLV58130.1 hypothetical protein D5018_18900 [Parashewanella curva]